MKNRKKELQEMKKLQVQIHSILMKNEKTYYLLQTDIFIYSNTF
jgi:hypothetical protein